MNGFKIKSFVQHSMEFIIILTIRSMSEVVRFDKKTYPLSVYIRHGCEGLPGQR